MLYEILCNIKQSKNRILDKVRKTGVMRYVMTLKVMVIRKKLM